MSRLTGALGRSFFVLLLIGMPSLLLPSTHDDTTVIVALVALVAATFTFVEYNSAYPSFVEFRDAPPFNRVRFLALFLTVFALAVICRGKEDPSTLTRAFTLMGTDLGHSIDFPYSPVRLIVLMLPENASAALVDSVRTAAGIAYSVSIMALGVFVLTLRLNRWPSRLGAFNVWTNLPTFDPTAGGDVVDRLNRDATANLILGFLLPFMIPAIVKMTGTIFNPISLEDPHTLIWMMTAWAFLPASLLMRGIAMGRVAQMISNQRRRAYAAAQEEDRAHEGVANPA